MWLLTTVNYSYAQQQEQYFNRFQYHKFTWKVFHTSDFHIYFPAGNDSLASFISAIYPKVENILKQRMGTSTLKAPNIIIYPSVDQSYESNIGLYEQEAYTFPTLLKKSNRIVLAFNGSHNDLKDQLYEAIARSLWENQMKEETEDGITGGKPKKKDNIPNWFKEGAIRFFAHGWTIENEDDFRDSYQQNDFQYWEQSIGWVPRLSGQAFCYFLSEQYYPLAVMQLSNQLRTKSLQRSARLITKKNLDSLYRQCNQFYRQRFLLQMNQSSQNILKQEIDTTVIAKPKGVLNTLIMSPDGKQIAYVNTYRDVRTVYILNAGEKKPKKVTQYKLPPWINQHDEDKYPIIQWQGNNQLLVTLPVKGKLVTRTYSVYGGMINNEVIEGIDGIQQIEQLDRNNYLLSGWKNGQSDLVQYNLSKNRSTAITKDQYDDGAFTKMEKNGDQLFFVANRPEQMPQKKADTIKLKQGIYTAAGNEVKPFITDTIPYVQWSDALLLQDGSLTAATTQSGTKRFVLFPNANNKDFVSLGHYTPVKLLNDNKVSYYTQHGDSIIVQKENLQQWISKNRSEDNTSPWLISYENRARERAKEDSIINAAKSESPSFLEGILMPKDAKEQTKKREDSISKALTYDPKKIKPYVLQLHSAYFAAKINNDYYINRYQPYLNYQGQFKFPEIGGMVQGGFTDLFENHHFNIAFRLPAGNEGSDFFIHYTNTAKKLNWGATYFRKVESLTPDPKRNWTNESGDYYPNAAKVKTHYYELSADYPITYYLSAGITIAARQDRTIFLATEKYSLKFEDIKSLWSISTPFVTYNKLKPTVPFLYKGFKAKAMIDVFKAFSQKEETVLGSGMQLTYFQPLYKYITLEAKIKAGYSAGLGRILYNVGGTDNNVAPKVDSDVHFDQVAPYAFQTLVTPFRGHLQNTLYGDRYALVNADVYFPLFQTLIPIETPLESINLLQLGMFSDVATAKEAWNKSATEQGVLWSCGLSARTSLAGYPLRLEVAWPGEFNKKPIWYFSLSLK
jgi:hypothetical protein